MVGVSTALALQEHGHAVTLLDRRAPGEETSHGNAGMIQTEAVEPYVMPMAPAVLWPILTGAGNDVVLNYRGLRHWLMPALRYAWHSVSPAYQARIVPRWAEMILRASDDHARLVAASGAEDLINKDGYHKVYRSARALDLAASAARRIHERFGVETTALDASALTAAEPALRASPAGAIYYPQTWSCTDPGELVKRYAALFAARGGRVVQGDAFSLTRFGRSWALSTVDGTIEAEHAIVCLGPWSPQLLRRFGHNVPMVNKRGYHRHYSVEGGPRRPMLDVANGAFLSPMRRGLRVLTGAELNDRDAPQNLRQLTRATDAATELFGPLAPLEETAWIGTRPCMPDMLPRLGRSDREAGLWFNFGHGHQGFTLGPTTGRMLAERFP